MSCEHEWTWNDYAMCWHCPRCHGVSYSVACEAAKAPCAPTEPERAPPAPAIADMLDRALSADPWDRIGRKHGR